MVLSASWQEEGSFVILSANTFLLHRNGYNTKHCGTCSLNMCMAELVIAWQNGCQLLRKSSKGPFTLKPQGKRGLKVFWNLGNILDVLPLFTCDELWLPLFQADKEDIWYLRNQERIWTDSNWIWQSSVQGVPEVWLLAQRCTRQIWKHARKQNDRVPFHHIKGIYQGIYVLHMYFWITC